MLAIGRVRNEIKIARIDFDQYRVFEIYCQQDRALLAGGLLINRFGLTHIGELRGSGIWLNVLLA
ncbi:hypothetical protein ASD91_15910 [Pseudomonas sp. Root68]|nr:hypothetical protein ASD91_15910 [Pseudomonas sp. Root68]KRB70230.1 hypothetical protein ASD95_23905 [Pseudomonas sp. Root71]